MVTPNAPHILLNCFMLHLSLALSAQHTLAVVKTPISHDGSSFTWLMDSYWWIQVYFIFAQLSHLGGYARYVDLLQVNLRRLIHWRPDGTGYLLLLILFSQSLGAGLLAVGIWVRSDGPLWEYVQALDIIRYYNACYIIMTVGVLLLIFGFIGCLGAATEGPCLLSMYNVIMIICIILEIAACALVWSPAGGDNLQRELSRQIRYHVENRISSDVSRRFLDLIQLHLECCGAEAYVDYRNLNQDIPMSCNSARTNNIHIRSCGEMLRRKLEIRGAFIGGFSVSLMMLQVMSLLFNSGLLLLLKRDSDKFKLRLFRWSKQCILYRLPSTFTPFKRLNSFYNNNFHRLSFFFVLDLNYRSSFPENKRCERIGWINSVAVR